jgi:hypothetical protein
LLGELISGIRPIFATLRDGWQLKLPTSSVQHSNEQTDALKLECLEPVRKL